MIKTSSPPRKIVKVSKFSEIIYCPTKEDSNWNSHPKIYLNIGKMKHASCPYCGTKFVIED
ncbi:MAG: hypothetical protein CBD16_01630 [Betaproteobacteria bacterium TMED156]|nr:MAG: hypothetical protein CBD16_01630 [Betaproteobacteria bacterium TMED156]|tara:strand:+ start:1956 stop:2138 length:183 start_codon:yes stop_codon:yes gene_type:complete